MKPEINRERFEAWLFAQPKDRVVCLGSTEDCLLCSFVRETSPRNIIFSGWRYFRWHNTDYAGFDADVIPVWFEEFIVNRFRGRLARECTVTFNQLQKLYTETFERSERLLPEPSGELKQQQPKEKEEANHAPHF